MEQQLVMLVELQEIDRTIRVLTERKNAFPGTLASLDRRRTENKEGLNKSKEALQAAQKNKRDRDKDLEIGVQKVEKLKARTPDIKTNKEYQALLKEIETVEQENKAIEDDILGLMEKIDAAVASITAAESTVQEEDAAITAEQKGQEAVMAQIEEELKVAEQHRRAAAARCDPSILSQYQKLIATKAGMALAEARGESCSGCYMSIPPQVFVNVKKNESIINCPHCGRILYYKETIVQKDR